jgi:hypothetical protein
MSHFDRERVPERVGYMHVEQVRHGIIWKHMVRVGSDPPGVANSPARRSLPKEGYITTPCLSGFFHRYSIGGPIPPRHLEGPAVNERR